MRVLEVAHSFRPMGPEITDERLAFARTSISCHARPFHGGFEIRLPQCDSCKKPARRRSFHGFIRFFAASQSMQTKDSQSHLSLDATALRRFSQPIDALGLTGRNSKTPEIGQGDPIVGVVNSGPRRHRKKRKGFDKAALLGEFDGAPQRRFGRSEAN
nr:hypothetical protein [Candidatus Rhodoblastus alkanivorans]